ncbi:hypothetical protein [Streptomyces sp. NPDC059171]|uniref:hypothetical protein n=1 Tax=Streptomyces sp. NPDC059171 TaxID=3346755 RepID=UPI003688C0C7
MKIKIQGHVDTEAIDAIAPQILRVCGPGLYWVRGPEAKPGNFTGDGCVIFSAALTEREPSWFSRTGFAVRAGGYTVYSRKQNPELAQILLRYLTEPRNVIVKIKRGDVHSANSNVKVAAELLVSVTAGPEPDDFLGWETWVRDFTADWVSRQSALEPGLYSARVHDTGAASIAAASSRGFWYLGACMDASIVR